VLLAVSLASWVLGCPGTDGDLGVDERWWEETEGGVALLHVQMPGFGSSVAFQARFADIVTPAADDVYPQAPQDPDECATAQYTLEDVQNMDPGEYIEQSAGTITVDGEGLSLDLEPTMEDGQLVYYAELEENEVTYGGVYEVAAKGDEFPAFSGVLETTELIDLVSLDGFDTLDGDVSIQWEGNDGAHAFVTLVSMTEEYDAGGIVCSVENDGDFTIPGELVADLPDGNPSFLLQQYNFRRQEVDGRSLGFMAGSAVMYLGL